MFSFNKSLSPGSYSTLADLLAGVEILVYALGIHMFSPPASTLYLIARVLDVMWWRELRHTSARTRKALTSLYSTCSSLLGKMNLIPGLYAGVRILLSSHRLKSSPILSLLRRICGFLVSFLIVGFGAFAGCASHLVSIARGINRRLLLPEPKDGIDIVDDSTDMNTLLNIKPTTGLYGTNTDEGYESELLVYLMDEAVKGCLHIPDNNSSGGNVLVVKYRTVAYLVGAVETPIHTESTHFPENASCEVGDAQRYLFEAYLQTNDAFFRIHTDESDAPRAQYPAQTFDFRALHDQPRIATATELEYTTISGTHKDIKETLLPVSSQSGEYITPEFTAMDEKDCEVTDSSSGKLTSLLELSEKVESVQEVPAIVLGMPQETTGSPFEESGSSTFDEGQIEVDDDGFLDELFEGYGNMDLGSGSH